MQSIAALRAAVRQSLAYVAAQPAVAAAEVFAAANSNRTLRLNYTSHIPSNGVEEPKSVESVGLSVRAVFNDPDGVKIGMGSEPGNPTPASAAKALEQARKGAVHDPEFVSLPTPEGRQSTLSRYHDPALARISAARLLSHGWQLLEQGLDAFQSAEELRDILRQLQQESPDTDLADLGLIIGGDLALLSFPAPASHSFPLTYSPLMALISPLPCYIALLSKAKARQRFISFTDFPILCIDRQRIKALISIRRAAISASVAHPISPEVANARSDQSSYRLDRPLQRHCLRPGTAAGNRRPSQLGYLRRL